MLDRGVGKLDELRKDVLRELGRLLHLVGSLKALHGALRHFALEDALVVVGHALGLRHGLLLGLLVHGEHIVGRHGHDREQRPPRSSQAIKVFQDREHGLLESTGRLQHVGHLVLQLLHRLHGEVLLGLRSNRRAARGVGLRSSFAHRRQHYLRRHVLACGR